MPGAHRYEVERLALGAAGDEQPGIEPLDPRLPVSLDGHADGIPNGAGDVARGGSGRDHAFGREVRPEELATQGYLGLSVPA